jgi:hypothetical protein
MLSALSRRYIARSQICPESTVRCVQQTVPDHLQHRREHYRLQMRVVSVVRGADLHIYISDNG